MSLRDTSSTQDIHVLVTNPGLEGWSCLSCHFRIAPRVRVGSASGEAAAPTSVQVDLGASRGRSRIAIYQVLPWLKKAVFSLVTNWRNDRAILSLALVGALIPDRCSTLDCSMARRGVP